MTRVIHYICNIKIKDFLLCQYVIYGPRKKSIIEQYIKSKGIYQPENLMSNGSSRHDDAAQTK